jgi:nitroreductase
MNLVAQEKNLQASPLDVPSAIIKRRAIKSFKTDAIAPELLKQLVELTVAAPSSYNLQDWRIVLVQSEAQKAALSEAAWGQQQIADNPDIAIAVLVPVGYAAEPRKNAGRLPLSHNVFEDRIGNPYQG